MENNNKKYFSDSVYDKMKFLTTIVLPAIGVLYFALSGIWGFPYGEQVIGSITAIVTFLGVVLGVTTSNYNKSDAKYDGSLNVNDTNPEVDLYSLELNDSLNTLYDKDSVTFKVKK